MIWIHMRVKLYISLIHCQLIRFTERNMSVSNDITDSKQTKWFFGNVSFTCFKKIWFNEILRIWAHFYTEKIDCSKNFDAMRISEKKYFYENYTFFGRKHIAFFSIIRQIWIDFTNRKAKNRFYFLYVFFINCFIPLSNSNDSNFLREDTCNLIQLIVTMMWRWFQCYVSVFSFLKVQSPTNFSNFHTFFSSYTV